VEATSQTKSEVYKTSSSLTAYDMYTTTINIM